LDDSRLIIFDHAFYLDLPHPVHPFTLPAGEFEEIAGTGDNVVPEEVSA
jgi:hypothetical protein